ncbi:MAG: hypothetical protein R2850_06485 [Bacteroidia bacterium]
MVFDTSSFQYVSCALVEHNASFYVRQLNNTDELLYNFDLPEMSLVSDASPFPTCGISSPQLSLLDTVCIGPIYRKR